MDFELKPYGKTERLTSFGITITEKLDGTNACIVIQNNKLVGCQSRKNKITPEKDNMGFANWVYSNEELVTQLGDGYHYGECCGPGIQKNPMRLEEKQLFLFNVMHPQTVIQKVPVLYTGEWLGLTHVNDILAELKDSREYDPEGVIVYFHNFKTPTKVTYNNMPKWMLENGN